MSRKLYLGIVCLLSSSISLAQINMPTQGTVVKPLTLTSRDGETIVHAAWKRERQTRSKPDCSHLVHEVYALAGYPYPYADSFDLYAGVDSFIRVTRPQPGDLIVWRGHVGIVVDPARHSFYSSVTSGLREEFYDAPQWTVRGPASFYRYVLGTPRVTPADKLPLQMTKGTVLPVENSRENSPSMATTMKTEPSTAMSASELPSGRPSLDIPSTILIAASLDRPSQAEVAGAISELNNRNGVILRENGFSRLDRPLIIYDSPSVDRAKFQGNRGSVQFRVNALVTMLGGRIEQTPHYEGFRWELMRVNAGWAVLTPKDRVYVPRDIAVGILAAQLTSLAQDSEVYGSDSSIRQQTEIVHVLNALFEADR